jgi:hypothetical protein
MCKSEIPVVVSSILEEYDPVDPDTTASALRTYWLTFEPKSIAGIKAEQREMQETAGIPVPVLQTMGREIAKAAKIRVDAFIPLTKVL